MIVSINFIYFGKNIRESINTPANILFNCKKLLGWDLGVLHQKEDRKQTQD